MISKLSSTSTIFVFYLEYVLSLFFEGQLTIKENVLYELTAVFVEQYSFY